MASKIPAVVETYLDAVQFFQDGKLILGSSSLTGRHWNGSLWCFRDTKDAPDVEKCLAGIETSAGVCDLLCLENERVVVASESGSIEIYRLDSAPEIQAFTDIFSSCEHEGSILNISCNSNKTNIISAGSDKCVKIWDTSTFAIISTYKPVHAGMVWQASCSTIESHIFLTCGQDGKLLLFDLRLQRPLTILECGPKESCPMSIAWKPESTTMFLVGDDSGMVSLNDIRNKGSISKWDVHKRGVFRMRFSPTCQNWLATCADDTEVCITNLEKEVPHLLYRDDRHDDFIRGLAWNDENTLITSGWDKKVFQHVISQMDVVR